MKVHTYAVEHDLGFAPNPFHGVCSLACCAPRIRKYAKVGDLVVGRGSARFNRRDNLVYWMKIDRIIDFEAFDLSGEFRDKMPNMAGSSIQRFGDNIYFKDPETGAFRQRDSFHSHENGGQSQADIDTDTGISTNVLLATEFSYFGAEGPKIPEELRSMFLQRGWKYNHAPDQQDALVAWLQIAKPKYLHGLPTDWSAIAH